MEEEKEGKRKRKEGKKNWKDRKWKNTEDFNLNIYRGRWQMGKGLEYNKEGKRELEGASKQRKKEREGTNLRKKWKYNKANSH